MRFSTSPMISVLSDEYLLDGSGAVVLRRRAKRDRLIARRRGFRLA
jgi:hypothetical protein